MLQDNDEDAYSDILKFYKHLFLLSQKFVSNLSNIQTHCLQWYFGLYAWNVWIGNVCMDISFLDIIVVGIENVTIQMQLVKTLHYNYLAIFYRKTMKTVCMPY